MKHISFLRLTLLIVITTFIPGTTWGSPIDEHKARLSAKRFFSQRAVCDTSTILLTLVRHVSIMQKGAPATPLPYYIFNRQGGGFIIIAADDVLPEVLGYSDNGELSFSKMPENTRWWLDEYEREARHALANHQYAIYHESNDDEEHSPIAPMLTSRWGQQSPYNNQTPIIEGEHAPTGCVATALAQIFRYNQWPDSIGSIPGTNVCEELPPVTFQWDKMHDEYNGDEPQESQEAVAQLMRYTGQAVSTSYGQEISTAYRSSTIQGCISFLRLNEIHCIMKNQCTDKEWEDSIYNNLLAGHPVFFAGSPPRDSGHAFVCDGYENGFYHFNWGWNGNCDGYFLLTALSPTASADYNSNQYILTGLHKHATHYESKSKLTVSDMAFNIEESDANCLERNTTDDNFTGLVVYDVRDLRRNVSTKRTSLALMLYQDTTAIALVSDIFTWKANNKKAMTNRFNVNLGKQLPDGEYQIRAVSRETGTDQWILDDGAFSKYLNVSIKGLKMDICSNIIPLAVDSFLTGIYGKNKHIGNPHREGDARLKAFMKLNNYNSPLHLVETAVSIFSETGSAVYTSQPQPFSGDSWHEALTEFNGKLEEGKQYYLRGVCRERGSDEWLTMLNTEELFYKFLTEGDSVVFGINSETEVCCDAFLLDGSQYKEYFTKAYARDTITHDFKNILISTSLRIPDETYRIIDHALALYKAEGTTEPIDTIATYCAILSAKGGEVFNVADSITIRSTLADGHYLLKAIGRDSSRKEWIADRKNEYGSCLHLFIEDDTLKIVPDYEYNLRDVVIERVVFRNKQNNYNNYSYNYWVYLQNLSSYQAFGNIHLSYLNENSEPEDVVCTLSTESPDSLELNIVHPINSEYDISVVSEDIFQLGRNNVVPRHENYELVGIGVFSDDRSVDVSNVNKVSFWVKKEREMNDDLLYIQFKCLDDPSLTGSIAYINTLYKPDETLTYNYYCRGRITDDNSYRDWIGKRCIVEVGYMSNWNEYQAFGYSEEMIPKGFMFYYIYDEEKTRQSAYTTAAIASFHQTLSDTIIIPEDALFCNMVNVYANQAHIIPNQNPNCIFELNSNDSIPDCLKNYPTVNNIRVDSLTIVDGYPVFAYNYFLYKKLSFLRTFEADKWTTVAIPFMINEVAWNESGAPDLYQLSCQDGAFVLVPYTHNGFMLTSRKMVVAKGNGKTIDILEKNYGNSQYSSRIESFFPSDINMNRFTIFSSCFSNHLSAFYELSDDGKALVLKSGETLPYRTYLIPNTDYRPDSIRVWHEGEIPTDIQEVDEELDNYIVARYALDGRRVDDNYKGIVILLYRDGTTRKKNF